MLYRESLRLISQLLHREITALLYRETEITALLYRESLRLISQLCYTGRVPD